jgi:cytochrome c oxidase subunit IV
MVSAILGIFIYWQDVSMKEKQGNHERHEIKYQIIGWILFILCAIFFIVSSLRNQDILTFIGSVIFLIACIVFIIPLIRTNKNKEI